MPLRKIFAVLVLQLAVGTASGSKDRVKNIFVPAFNCGDMSLGVKLPMDLPGLLRMGSGFRESTDWVEKRNEYEITHKYLFSDGLALGVSTFSQAPRRYSITFVEISSPRWSALSAFKVGAKVGEARKLLGVDAGEDPDFTAAYVGGRDGIEFTSSNGELKSVVYKCAENQPEQWK